MLSYIKNNFLTSLLVFPLTGLMVLLFGETFEAFVQASLTMWPLVLVLLCLDEKYPIITFFN